MYGQQPALSVLIRIDKVANPAFHDEESFDFHLMPKKVIASAYYRLNVHLDLYGFGEFVNTT